MPGAESAATPFPQLLDVRHAWQHELVEFFLLHLLCFGQPRPREGLLKITRWVVNWSLLGCIFMARLCRVCHVRVTILCFLQSGLDDSSPGLYRAKAGPHTASSCGVATCRSLNGSPLTSSVTLDNSGNARCSSNHVPSPQYQASRRNAPSNR